MDVVNSTGKPVFLGLKLDNFTLDKAYACGIAYYGTSKEKPFCLLTYVNQGNAAHTANTEILRNIFETSECNDNGYRMICSTGTRGTSSYFYAYTSPGRVEVLSSYYVCGGIYSDEDDYNYVNCHYEYNYFPG